LFLGRIGKRPVIGGSNETFVSTLIRKSGDVLKGNMKKIILCRGIQASGKSTFSKAWAQEAPKERVRFCYDDLRMMLGGGPEGYWVPSREGILKELRDSFMAAAMEKGYDIIIDNMNLNPKETEYYQGLIQGTDYVLEYHDFFDVSLAECIKRDSLRPSPIGAAVLTATYNRYKNIIEGKEDSK
jgi:predicted kinase